MTDKSEFFPRSVWVMLAGSLVACGTADLGAPAADNGGLPVDANTNLATNGVVKPEPQPTDDQQKEVPSDIQLLLDIDTIAAAKQPLVAVTAKIGRPIGVRLLSRIEQNYQWTATGLSLGQWTSVVRQTAATDDLKQRGFDWVNVLFWPTQGASASVQNLQLSWIAASDPFHTYGETFTLTLQVDLQQP